MGVLILGLILFFAPHSLKMAAPGLRRSIIERRGEGAIKGLVAVSSLLGLILIVRGFAASESAILYTPPAWGHTLNAILMLPALILAVAGSAPAGHIGRAVVHPLLIATILWAVGHLLSVGDSAGVVLFGAFLIWSIADMVLQPEGASVSPPSIRSDIIAIIVGVVVYALLVWRLHVWLFGVVPLS